MTVEFAPQFSDRHIDFSVVKDAGLTHSEFARLCGVQRLTALRWIKRGEPPHRWLRAHLVTVLTRVSDAVEAGTLPIKRAKSAEENFRRVQKALIDASPQPSQAA